MKRARLPQAQIGIAAAQNFVNSEELKKAMHGAGVVGAPTIWFTKKV